MIFKLPARVIFFTLVFVFFRGYAQTNDTLGWNSFNDGFFHTSLSGLGSPTGNNVYGDRAKAQEFYVPEGWFVFTGAAARFKKVKDASSLDTSLVTFRLCAMNNLGTGSNGAQIASPGTIWQELQLPLSSIDTGIWFQIPFSSFAASERFAIVIDLTSLQPGDSISLYHSKPDQTISDDRSWEQRSDGSWKTLRYSWPLDVDLAILAMVERATGVEEEGSKHKLTLRRSQDFLAWENPGRNDNLMYIFDLQGKLLTVVQTGGVSGSISLSPAWRQLALVIRSATQNSVLLPVSN